MIVHRNFWPVGQGAFYTERFLDHDNTICNIVYDCGTGNSSQLIDDAIRLALHRGETIDAVFISHVHKDHVSGLPFLVKFCNVKRIYLPLLSELSRKYAILQNLVVDAGTHEAGFAENLLNDPRLALTSLEGNVETEIIGVRSTGYVDDNIDLNAWDLIISSGTNVMDDIVSRRRQKQLCWECIPYNFDQNARALQLMRNLRSVFGYDITIDEVIEIFKDENRVTEQGIVVKAYDSLNGKIHANCMTLYSGGNEYARQYLTNPFLCHLRKSGALYTGDYNAKSKMYYRALKNAYQGKWDMIGCLQLPHHGSAANFNQDFTNLDVYFIASSNPFHGGYHHPSQSVASALTGKDFLNVTDRPHTRVALEITDAILNIPSFGGLCANEHIGDTLLSNTTFEEIYNLLRTEAVIERMITFINDDRPPLDAVIEGVEDLCDEPGSELHLTQNGSNKAKQSIGKIVREILRPFGYEPYISKVKDKRDIYREKKLYNSKYIKKAATYHRIVSWENDVFERVGTDDTTPRT